MSIQISVDPTTLSQEQREAVAGFILAYPSKACAGTCHDHAVAEIHAHTHEGQTGDSVFPVQPGVAVNELEALQHDHESTMPEAAFGKPDEAAAAFGVPTTPLTLGATAAPFTAGAAPSSIAPAATTGTSGAMTSTAPVPPAPTPANVAPTAAPPTVSPAGGVELDSKGLPWDSRIHAESKGKIADGTWRKKRNLDPALVAQVEAELRQVMGAAPAPLAPVAATPAQPAANVTTPTPGVASSAAVAPVPPIAPQPPAPSVPPAPVAGAAPIMPAAPSAAPGEVPADARQQFVGLVGRASAAIQGGKVSQAEVNQCCVDAGVPALPLLANRLDLVAQVAAHIDALIAARQ